jgi:cytidylate kinase
VPERKPIIAIDGPAGSGKSTVAKALAKRLGFLYIDTGAMYRCVTLAALRRKIDFEDAAQIEQVAREIKIRLEAGESRLNVYLDGEEVENLLRTPEVSWLTSQKTANAPGVRQALVSQQQALGARGGVVMEGRDIATVVFPGADLKIYFDVSVEERTRRRIADFQKRAIEFEAAQVRSDIEKRDTEDRSRPLGALKKADGAVTVLGDGKSVEDILAEILALLPSQGV